MLQLLLGVKRRLNRKDDANHQKADAEFSAKRKGILEAHRFICQGCGYESKPDAAAKKAPNLDVHHLDDDHHNNQDSNLCPACHTCHPYQHVGELSYRTDARAAGAPTSEALGRFTRIAFIPEISPADLNLLQRVIGYALNDPKEAEMAKKMIGHLADRAFVTKRVYGTFMPADFAGAMSMLTNDEYAQRDDAIADLRLLFNEKTLLSLGSEMMKDYPTMPISSWPSIGHGVKRKSPLQEPDKTMS
jgi:hypothetical protein